MMPKQNNKGFKKRPNKIMSGFFACRKDSKKDIKSIHLCTAKPKSLEATPLENGQLTVKTVLIRGHWKGFALSSANAFW